MSPPLPEGKHIFESCSPFCGAVFLGSLVTLKNLVSLNSVMFRLTASNYPDNVNGCIGTTISTSNRNQQIQLSTRSTPRQWRPQNGRIMFKHRIAMSDKNHSDKCGFVRHICGKLWNQQPLSMDWGKICRKPCFFTWNMFFLPAHFPWNQFWDFVQGANRHHWALVAPWFPCLRHQEFHPEPIPLQCGCRAWSYSKSGFVYGSKVGIHT